MAEHTLTLKANLDTSQVQQQLDRLQQNSSSAGDLSQLNTTITKLNDVLGKLGESMSRLQKNVDETSKTQAQFARSVRTLITGFGVSKAITAVSEILKLNAGVRQARIIDAVAETGKAVLQGGTVGGIAGSSAAGVGSLPGAAIGATVYGASEGVHQFVKFYKDEEAQKAVIESRKKSYEEAKKAYGELMQLSQKYEQSVIEEALAEKTKKFSIEELKTESGKYETVVKQLKVREAELYAAITEAQSEMMAGGNAYDPETQEKFVNKTRQLVEKYDEFNAEMKAWTSYEKIINDELTKRLELMKKLRQEQQKNQEGVSKLVNDKNQRERMAGVGGMDDAARYAEYQQTRTTIDTLRETQNSLLEQMASLQFIGDTPEELKEMNDAIAELKEQFESLNDQLKDEEEYLKELNRAEPTWKNEYSWWQGPRMGDMGGLANIGGSLGETLSGPDRQIVDQQRQTNALLERIDDKIGDIQHQGTPSLFQ